jgi:hypothetical protein
MQAKFLRHCMAKRKKYVTQKGIQDPYVTAMDISEFSTIKKYYTQCKNKLAYLKAQSVQEITKIYWSFYK